MTNLEEFIRGLDATNPNTDADGFSDFIEINAGTDPTDTMYYPELVEGPETGTTTTSPTSTILTMTPTTETSETSTTEENQGASAHGFFGDFVFINVIKCPISKEIGKKRIKM